MPFFRFLFVFILIPVILSAGLLVWGILSMPEKSRGKYASLVFDETVPDREIRELLEKKGFTGMVSESGLYVLLDVFDTVEFVPLDEYENRVLPFDPRNDGYAQRLRSMFVRDGKRHVYIPVSGIRKKLALLPEGFSYSLEIEKSNTPPVFLLLLFGLSAGVFFVVKPLRRALAPYSACLIPCLPALTPLALGGTAGFAMTALLAGFAVFLSQVINERQSSRSLFYRATRRRVSFPALLPVSFLFLACCCLLAFFSDLSLGFALSAVGLFCGIFFIFLRLVSVSGKPETWKISFQGRETGYRRFKPVQIMGGRESGFRFPFAIFPFAVMAFVPAFFDIDTSVSSPANLLPPNPVTGAEWQDHFYFQTGFSTRSLYDGAYDTYMLEYTLSQDGLIIPVPDNGGTEPAKLAAPPFPLGDFLHDLEKYHRTVNAASRRGGAVPELLYAIVPLFFIVPAFVRRRKEGKEG